jgi:hypothetical protein
MKQKLCIWWYLRFLFSMFSCYRPRRARCFAVY